MKRLKYQLFSFGIAIALLIVFMNFIGWNELYTVYKNANPYILIPALVSSFIAYFMLAYVWKTILDFLKVKIPFRFVYRMFYMSVFTNYITPLGQAGGEPFMAFVLSKKAKIRYSKALASIMSADVLSAIVPISFSSLGLIYFVFYGNPSLAALQAIVAVILLGILIMTGILILQLKKNFVEKLALIATKAIRAILGFVKYPKTKYQRHLSEENTKRRLKTFYETFHSIIEEKRGAIILLIFISALGQTLCLHFSVLALGYNCPFILLLAVFSLSGIASFIPLPGGLGGIEIAAVGLLVLLCGLPLTVATGATLLFRFITYWIPLGIGGAISAYALRKPLYED